MKYLYTLFVCILSVLAFGQAGPPEEPQPPGGGPVNVIDGVYINEHIPTRRGCFVHDFYQSEPVWSKRVWRTISTTNNSLLFQPVDSSGTTLWTVLKAHTLNGDLSLFSAWNPYADGIIDGDAFQYPVNMGDEKTYFCRLPGPGDRLSDSDTSWFVSADIAAYRLKEDWYFDKVRSVLDVRIVGIAPVVLNGEQEMVEAFWLYFPACRTVLEDAFLPETEWDHSMSFDDLFWKRRFTSTIDRQTNALDPKEAYRILIDQLLESERITAEMIRFSEDIWNF
jgi:gliding motility associated protien GldN